MKVLLTNDDGINAVGIKSAWSIIKAIYPDADIWTIAPSLDESCQSHSVTMNKSISLHKLSEREYSVDGSPADCVIIGLGSVLKKDKPDIVISGINAGANIGIDKLYSGTIAAAMEGYLHGLPAIALSQTYEDIKEEVIAKHLKHSASSNVLQELLKQLITYSIQSTEPVCTSVNIPFNKEIKGYKVRTMGTQTLDFCLREHSGSQYSICCCDVQHFPDVDIKEGYVTMTPLCPDWTRKEDLRKIEKYLES